MRCVRLFSPSTNNSTTARRRASDSSTASQSLTCSASPGLRQAYRGSDPELKRDPDGNGASFRLTGTAEIVAASAKRVGADTKGQIAAPPLHHWIKTGPAQEADPGRSRASLSNDTACGGSRTGRPFRSEIPAPAWSSVATPPRSATASRSRTVSVPVNVAAKRGSHTRTPLNGSRTATAPPG